MCSGTAENPVRAFVASRISRKTDHPELPPALCATSKGILTFLKPIHAVMVWKVKGASVGTNRAVRSGIPSLVIGAQYDAYTDPAWGRSVSARLSKSHFVEIPWAGHGPAFSVPCVAGMIADFFDDPGRASGTECVESTRRQFKFVTR